MEMPNDFEQFTDDEDFLELVDVLVPRPVQRPRKYHERRNMFLYWDDQEFLARYRLPKDTVHWLTHMIGDISGPTDWNHAVSTEEMVLVTLRFFATGTFHQVNGDIHGLHKSTVSRIIYKVSRAIADRARDFIKMPESQQERLEKMQGFYNIARFPKCIGALDCTHIKIMSPGGQEAEIFRNRKDFFSLNAQAICDANLIIENIVVRWPGSSHDSTIFNNSRVRGRFENGVFGEAILLGDSGYPVKPFLLTPLANPQNRAEHLYNEAHIRTRNPIERCFGVLKRRFPTLALGMRLKLDRVQAVVIACAVLHNIAIMRNVEEPPVTDEILEAINRCQVENENVPEVRRGENNIVRNTIIREHFGVL